MSEFLSGTNLCRAAVESGYPLQNIFIEEHNFALINYMRERRLPFKLLSRQKMDATARHHQGIIVEIASFLTYDLHKVIRSQSVPGFRHALLLVLDGLEDPNNLGAILRVADAVGADGLIYRRDRNIRLNATAARVSAGAVFHVKCVEVTNITSALKQLKSAGYWIIGAEAGPDSQDYRNVTYDAAAALVIGSEGRGLSRLVRENCDYVVRLPMAGKINSLNAAVAAGVLSYHIKNEQN